MKADERESDEILNHVLAKVRETRTRRKIVKSGIASGLALALAWLWIDRQAPGLLRQESVEARPASRGEAAAPTLAVVVWRNGVASLEELGAAELAGVELEFSLDPVVAYPEADWMFPQ